MLDVVYLVREGDNPELRWSLRSLRNVDHGTVWIVGHKPKWCVNVEHLPLRQGRDRYENTLAAVHTAVTHPDITDDFQLWNDDFYAVKPTKIPNWHRGVVEPSTRHRNNSPVHLAGREFTRRLLTKWGIDPVLDYGIHAPMVMNRQRMVEALRRAAPHGIRALHRRTLYGNLYQIGGTEHADPVIGNVDDVWKPEAEWAATSDRTFEKGAVGEALRELFTDPSPYEGEPHEDPATACQAE